MNKYFRTFVFAWACGSLVTHGQAPVEVSPPQGVTVSIYDIGIGMVNEARRVALTAGESVLAIRDLPVQIEPASLSFATATRSAPFDLLEQTVRYDMTSLSSILHRMKGRPVNLQLEGATREGVLLAGPLADHDAIPVGSRDGKNVWLLDATELDALTFPTGRDVLAVDPFALWRVRVRQEGPQNFRLAYRTDGMSWRAHYELFLENESQQADFNVRVEIDNQSGGRFENARARLLVTERGQTEPIVAETPSTVNSRPAMRYAYGASQPAFERSIASMAPVETYELPRTVTLEPDQSTFVEYVRSVAMPVKRFYVYDGVRFDQFQRNPKTDWNYGTEDQPNVQMHLEFENAEKFGLGMGLPPGRCRLYQVRTDGVVDLIGEEMLVATPAGANGFVRVGPAVGLRGERERTGYTEIKPHHVYEESFQIRLMNGSDEKNEIRVVEHLYRWPDYEITRADAEYTRIDPQTIEFRMELEPAARKAINYTVRYTW